MNRYLVILGRTVELAFAELVTVIKRNDLETLHRERLNHAVIFNTKEKADLTQLLRTLGGTIKIGIIGKTVDPRDFLDEVTTILRNEAIGKAKLTFGISLVNSKDRSQRFLVPKAIKDKLDAGGIKSRYILPKESDELTSSQVKLTELVELYLIWREGKILVGRTVAVQDFAGFSQRDYGRPYTTPKEGMLPPKVARMMVNLAFPQRTKKDLWLLDPFCGTGTIAMEALILGIHCLNADLKGERVEGTRKNLAWVTQREKLNARWEVFQGDATQISKGVKREVDAIVTEPYLGPSILPPHRIPNLAKGLTKLYIGCLKEWRRLLLETGRVVMVCPEFRNKSGVKITDVIIDRCENLGYTLNAGPFSYFRPKAKIIRNILVLEKRKERNGESQTGRENRSTK